MGKIALFVKRVLVMLGILMAFWLPLVAFVHYLEMTAVKDLAASMWITRAESLRMMRYHGTYGLKVTHDRVYIRRDSKWIEVLKRKQGGPQVSG
jgi:hypothetical protein